MLKIRKNDEVIVITGKYKGKRGKVLKVIDGGNRLFVESINIVKRHTRANPNISQPGGIVEKEASIHVSNVAIYNSTSGKADRVGFKLVDGAKYRVFKSNNEAIDA